MTAKEYLMQYRDAVRRASAAQDHLTELRAMAERITPNYGSSGGGSHASVHMGAEDINVATKMGGVDND